MKRIALLALAAAAIGGCQADASVEYEGPYAEDVRESIAEIERITGLPFKAPPRVATRARADLRAVLEREFEDKQGEELPLQAAAFKRLGLLPESVDLKALLLDLLTEQVIGFYLPLDSTLYLVDDAPAMARRGILTHELVHALQGQYLDLDSIQRMKGDDDRQLAAQAVLEGQAQFVMMRSMGQFMSVEQQRTAIRRAQADMPKFAAAPLFVQEVVIFPYLSGNEFVRQVLDSMPDEPLFANIPASTEQVLHWGAFAGERDAPVRVTLPGPRRGTGAYRNTLGEFGTRILLYNQTRQQPVAVSAAQGWDGDQYLLVRTPQGDGIAWVTIWDTPVDAAEFQSAMRTAIDRRFYKPRERRLPDESVEYAAEGRAVRLWGGEIAGRPAVLYVDMPEGAGSDVLDLGAVRVEER